MITMRPTGLSFPVERDGKDYTVSSGEWAMDCGPRDLPCRPFARDLEDSAALTLRKPLSMQRARLGRCIDAHGQYRPSSRTRASVPPDPTHLRAQSAFL
jgi:hypothetical protein